MSSLIKTIWVFSVFFFSNQVCLPAQDEQLLSLNKLIENLKGNHNEPSIKKFDTIEEACDSEFINCDAALRVIDLNFQFSNLNGFISKELLDLSSLETVNFEYNYLHGSIPNGLEKLASLKELLLTGNYLSGTLPKGFQKMKAKVKVNLSKNAFDIEDEALIKKLKIYNQIDTSAYSPLDSFLLKNRQDLKRLNAQRLSGIDKRPVMQGHNSGSTKFNLSLHMKFLTYPEIAKANNIKGAVQIRFFVSKEGTIKGSHIIKDIGGRCGNAALWQINRLNAKYKWIPGVYDEEKVDVPFGLSVKFGY